MNWLYTDVTRFTCI